MQSAACRKVCSKSSVVWTFEPRPLINIMRWSLNKGFRQSFNALCAALNCRRNLQIRKLNCIRCFGDKTLLITPASNGWNRCVREYPLPKSIEWIKCTFSRGKNKEKLFFFSWASGNGSPQDCKEAFMMSWATAWSKGSKRDITD